jgi:hypothetical protein
MRHLVVNSAVDWAALTKVCHKRGASPISASQQAEQSLRPRRHRPQLLFLSNSAQEI